MNYMECCASDDLLYQMQKNIATFYPYLELLDSAIVDECFYGACKSKTDEYVFALVIHCFEENGSFFWQCDENTEFDSPYGIECPEAILDLLSATDDPTSFYWRAACRRIAEDEKRLNALSEGSMAAVQLSRGSHIMKKTRCTAEDGLSEMKWISADYSYPESMDAHLMAYFGYTLLS